MEESSVVVPSLLFGTFVFLSCVSSEYTGGGELTKFVADHVLSHIDGDELVAVVDSDGKTYEIRGDHRSAGPSLDRRFLTRCLSIEYALLQFVVYIGTFF